MAEKKKIFFTYSDADQTHFNNICLHFSVLQDKAEFWYKGKMLASDDVRGLINQKLSESDILLHLLSPSSANDEECTGQMKISESANKKVIVVLLSSYPWETDNKFSPYKNELLPENKQPIDLHNNFNEVCTEIVRDINESVFGQKSTAAKQSSRSFYWILGSLVLLIGCLTSAYVYAHFNELLITAIVFLMFVSIDLLILRRLLFPTNISTLKI